MKTGMIRGLSNNEYHENRCESASSVKTFIKNRRLHYMKHISREIKTNETPAMRFGSCCHDYILENGEFLSRNAVVSDGLKLTTKDGKAWKADNVGKTIISASDFGLIKTMNNSVYNNPTASILLSNGEAELSWIVDAGNFMLQSRTDWFVNSANTEQVKHLSDAGIGLKVGQPYICDLKTTGDIDAWYSNGWNNPIYTFGYYLQLGVYLAVVNRIRKNNGEEIVRNFFFIVVSKSAPYECKVIVVNERTFGLAQTELKPAIKELNRLYDEGGWPTGKEGGVDVCGVPERICNEIEQQIFESRDFSKIPFE